MPRIFESKPLIEYILAIELPKKDLSSNPRTVNGATSFDAVLNKSNKMGELYRKGAYFRWGYPSRSEAECALVTFFLKHGLGDAETREAMCGWALAYESWLKKSEAYRNCTMKAGAKLMDGTFKQAEEKLEFDDYVFESGDFGEYVKAFLPLPCLHNRISEGWASAKEFIVQFLREHGKMTFREVRDFYFECFDYYGYCDNKMEVIKEISFIHLNGRSSLACDAIRSAGLCISETGCKYYE